MSAPRSIRRLQFAGSGHATPCLFDLQVQQLLFRTARQWGLAPAGCKAAPGQPLAAPSAIHTVPLSRMA